MWKSKENHFAVLLGGEGINTRILNCAAASVTDMKQGMASNMAHLQVETLAQVKIRHGKVQT